MNAWKIFGIPLVLVGLVCFVVSLYLNNNKGKQNTSATRKEIVRLLLFGVACIAGAAICFFLEPSQIVKFGVWIAKIVLLVVGFIGVLVCTLAIIVSTRLEDEDKKEKAKITRLFTLLDLISIGCLVLAFFLL